MDTFVIKVIFAVLYVVMFVVSAITISSWLYEHGKPDVRGKRDISIMLGIVTAFAWPVSIMMILSGGGFDKREEGGRENA